MASSRHALRRFLAGTLLIALLALGVSTAALWLANICGQRISLTVMVNHASATRQTGQVLSTSLSVGPLDSRWIWISLFQPKYQTRMLGTVGLAMGPTEYLGLVRYGYTDGVELRTVDLGIRWALVAPPAIIIPLVWLVARWWKHRRRPLPNHCPSCGYDLTGNVSGRCPECGATVSAQSAERERG